MMDNDSFLKILRNEPDNEDVRLAYWNWLEENRDVRSPFVVLMRKRLRILEELNEVDAQIAAHQGPPIDDEWTDIAFPLRVRSPIVGRCYLKPTPDAAPYVEVGRHVTVETVVCLIESMKLFHEVKAGCCGIVSEITIENVAAVEYNQTLMRISRPSFDFW